MTDDETNGPTDHALAELLRTERHRAQIEERRRRNGLRRQADESVALLDVLGALAAHGAVVSVGTQSGELRPSTICDVGRDYIGLRCAESVVRLIPLGEVAAVRAISAGAAPGPAGAPPPELPLELGERLRDLATRRSAVRLIAGPAVITGRLRGVGQDVLVVERDDGPDTFVALAALAEVVVDP